MMLVAGSLAAALADGESFLANGSVCVKALVRRVYRSQGTVIEKPLTT